MLMAEFTLTIRGIDYSIANNEIPPRAEELPKVLNKVVPGYGFIFSAIHVDI